MRSGYIAITSALIITIILMMVIFGVSYTGFLNRFNVLGTYTKNISRYLAESCVEKARLKLASNILYAGNETVSIGADSCTIRPIEDNLILLQKTIKTQAIANKSYTDLKVIVNTVGLSLVSWEEVSNF